MEISVDDPTAADVRALLERHLAFSRATTPLEFSFALDVGQLTGPDITFFSARRDGELLGVAALRRLDESHVELKSMHTRQEARGQGVARALLVELITTARRHGYRRMSLETGTTEDFEAARRLYLSAGFEPCEPYGTYQPSPHNAWMTLALDAATRPDG
ncbi:MAG TPA: GNAT family N-acetyltransferase [Acidimicrobiales bacterium]|nr:GNAT family N-acetyltransferase [Acidimicrobiales bacterium]